MCYFGLAEIMQRTVKNKEYAEAVISFLPLKNRFGWSMSSMLIYLCVAKQIFGTLFFFFSVFTFFSLQAKCYNNVGFFFFFEPVQGGDLKKKKKSTQKNSNTCMSQMYFFLTSYHFKVSYHLKFFNGPKRMRCRI